MTNARHCLAAVMVSTGLLAGCTAVMPGGSGTESSGTTQAPSAAQKTSPATESATQTVRMLGLDVEPSYRPWRWAGGPNPDSWWDPRTGAQRIAVEMPLIAKAHAKQVRVEFPWTWLEPKPGLYHWGRADDIVNTATHYGLQVEPILAFCPKWEGPPTCVPEPADFSTFIKAFVLRYRTKINTFNIWTEPNCCEEKYFAGGETEYISRVLNPAYAAVKAVDPHGHVLTEVLGPDTGWIGGLKSGGAHFDIFSYHDYPADAATVNADGWTIRKKLNAEGYRSIPLWLDEFGVQEDSHADSTQQSWLETILAPGNNPATNIKLYNLRDDWVYCSATDVCSRNYYGLMGHGLAPKAAYFNFQRLAR